MADRIDESISRLIARADDHFEDLMAHRQKFHRIADELRPWIEHWPTGALETRLNHDDVSPRERDRLLVALALQSTPEAICALDTYEPAEGEAKHRLFYRVVRIESENAAAEQSPEAA